MSLDLPDPDAGVRYDPGDAAIFARIAVDTLRGTLAYRDRNPIKERVLRSFAELLLLGGERPRIAGAAAHAGVPRGTVTAWLSRDARFRSDLEELVRGYCPPTEPGSLGFIEAGDDDDDELFLAFVHVSDKVLRLTEAESLFERYLDGEDIRAADFDGYPEWTRRYVAGFLSEDEADARQKIRENRSFMAGLAREIFDPMRSWHNWAE